MNKKWLNSTKVHGFNLIEVMIVLALLSIIAALTISSTHFLHGLIVKSELYMLERTCQYLKQRALSTGTTTSLRFDEHGQYYEHEGIRHLFARHVTLGILPDVKGPPSLATAVIKSPVTFKDYTITFSPDGIISSGTVYMVDTKKMILYALSSGVSKVSFMRLYRYDGAWKLLTD